MIPVKVSTMGEEKRAVTEALIGASGGDREAAAELWDLTYEELRRIAYRLLQSERSDHTLSGTALVHEAFVRLVDQDRVQWQDRAHFFAVAAARSSSLSRNRLAAFSSSARRMA